MQKVPYISVVESLMYVMICTKLDIIYAMGVIRRFFINLSKEHYVVMK